MYVKLLGRFSKDEDSTANSEIEDELRIQQLLHGDSFDTNRERQKLISKLKAYDYVPIVLNLKDIMLYNMVDDKHTSVKLYGGISFTFLITMDQFMGLHQDFLGIMIYDCTQPQLKIKLENEPK